MVFRVTAFQIDEVPMADEVLFQQQRPANVLSEDRRQNSGGTVETILKLAGAVLSNHRSNGSNVSLGNVLFPGNREAISNRNCWGTGGDIGSIDFNSGASSNPGFGGLNRSGSFRTPGFMPEASRDQSPFSEKERSAVLWGALASFAGAVAQHRQASAQNPNFGGMSESISYGMQAFENAMSSAAWQQGMQRAPQSPTGGAFSRSNGTQGPQSDQQAMRDVLQIYNYAAETGMIPNAAPLAPRNAAELAQASQLAMSSMTSIASQVYSAQTGRQTTVGPTQAIALFSREVGAFVDQQYAAMSPQDQRAAAAVSQSIGRIDAQLNEEAGRFSQAPQFSPMGMEPAERFGQRRGAIRRAPNGD
ncbi:MAG: hypothetical protein IT290_02180 [Deltaproteobacteria bacterium]|nr:hypothetical protein [Deltaproteobacteria bacterium]